MGRLGRYLEAIACFDRAGRLALYRKLETALQDVGGLDSRMRVSPDRHSRPSTSNVTYPDAGPSICDKIFRVTPGVAAGCVPCADASVATNSVIPQIAHDAKPVNPRLVSMTLSLPVVRFKNAKPSSGKS
jgi:hypothetical protein